MEHNTSMVVDGWDISRSAGPTVDGSTRLKAAEALARFAEAEKFKAAAMLHAEAQQAVPSLLDDLAQEPGMGTSLRTGRMAEQAATESAALEVALVCGISPGQGQRILDQAETLVLQTPEVIDSLASGRLGSGHVQKILEQVKYIVPETLPALPREADQATREEWEREKARLDEQARAARRDFGADMLATAPGKSPAQLRTRGRQLLEKYYGLSYTKRSRTAMRDRRIMFDEDADGMSWFSAFLPTAGCHAIFSRIDAMARVLKADPASAADLLHPEGNGTPAPHSAAASGPGTPMTEATDDPTELRTVEQLRADVFMDLLLEGPAGKGLASIQPEVFVTIPATMLPGLPGGPTAETESKPSQVGTAELPPGAEVPTVLGGGVVDQESAARFMAAAKTWWRVVTDPMTGAIVKFGQRKYRPSAAQRAALRFRDGGCCTPGCPGRVEDCDVDHDREWQEGGGTDLGNLYLRCRRCHRLKSWGLLDFEEGADGSVVARSLFGTRQGRTPAAPWAVGDPGRAATVPVEPQAQAPESPSTPWG
ncbi:MAG: HNH endonuclease, partial [Micrococcaceae bacterium]|nr:HNH endonuclease [Micrococcaceae bacterium]